MPRGKFALRCTSFRFVCVGNKFMFAKRVFDGSSLLDSAGKPRGRFALRCTSFRLVYVGNKFVFAKRVFIT